MECEENGRTGTRKESSGYMSISGPLFKPETSRGVFFFCFFFGVFKAGYNYAVHRGRKKTELVGGREDL